MKYHRDQPDGKDQIVPTQPPQPSKFYQYSRGLSE